MPLTIKSLHVYPVKGLKGIDLTEAAMTERGLQHDRRWMVVDGDGEFLTQRDYPKMATLWTDISGGHLVLSAPDADDVAVPLESRGKPIRVSVWRSTVDAIPASTAADEFLSDQLGLACRLVYMPDSTRRMSNPDYAGKGKLVGFADGYAYLVTNQSTLADLNARLLAKGHAALPMNRFRPNIVVEGAAPYAEDRWQELGLGSDAVIRAAKPCGRCEVTTTDQTTGEVRGPEPLATLATYRDSKRFGVVFGMNMVTVKTGRVRVGDAVDTRAPA